MTSSSFKSEVLAGPERRRRRTPAEKLAIVAETQEAGVTVSLVDQANLAKMLPPVVRETVTTNTVTKILTNLAGFSPQFAQHLNPRPLRTLRD